MRRRILATVLAALMALSLTACGGNTTQHLRQQRQPAKRRTDTNDTAGEPAPRRSRRWRT